jgi:hypothetical protein
MGRPTSGLARAGRLGHTDAVSGSTDARLPHDLWARLALSPVFAVLVPMVSGLIDNRRHTPFSLALTYAIFSLLAFLIWEGNRQLQGRLQRREDWLERPWRRAGVLVGSILLFTIPFAAAVLLSWQHVTGDHGLTPFGVPAAVAVIVAIVAVITNIYEMFFVLRGWESERLRAARAESARLSAEMERLVREVDPHFLFNNLHALTHLVEQGSPKAASFIEALGDTYHYVLAARRRPLVTLKEELAALDRQCELAAARYGNGIALDVAVPADEAERLRLPPVTLSELLTNALKHNTVSAEAPLTLRLELQGDVLVVSHRIGAPSSPSQPSTGVGLRNLAARHRLATGHDPSWGVEGGRFVVRIPLGRSA